MLWYPAGLPPKRSKPLPLAHQPESLLSFADGSVHGQTGRIDFVDVTVDPSTGLISFLAT